MNEQKWDNSVQGFHLSVPTLRKIFIYIFNQQHHRMTSRICWQLDKKNHSKNALGVVKIVFFERFFTIFDSCLSLFA